MIQVYLIMLIGPLFDDCIQASNVLEYHANGDTIRPALLLHYLLCILDLQLYELKNSNVKNLAIYCTQTILLQY